MTTNSSKITNVGPLYPAIAVPIAGEDPNLLAAFGRCPKAAQAASWTLGSSMNLPKRVVTKRCRGISYNGLVTLIQKWFTTT